MYGAGRYYFNYYSKFFVVLQGDFFIQHNRVITGIVQSALCQQNPLIQGAVHFPGSRVRQVPGRIQLVLCILVRCIETCGSQILSLTGPVGIGKPSLVLPVANLSHPSAQIALMDVVVIVHRLHTCVYNIMDTNIAVKIGYIKISLVPKILSPAVGTDKRAVPCQVQVEILPGIIIIPSNDNRIMIRLFVSDVTIGVGLPVIVNGLAPIIPHGCIQGALYSPPQVHSPFNGLVILGGKNLNLLYMHAGRKAVRRNSVSVWVLGFRHRSLPGQQIGHGHGIFSALVLSQEKTVVHGHMVHRKGHGLSRKQGGLQGSQRRKGPAGSQGSLVSNLGRPARLSVVIGRRKLYIGHVPPVPLVHAVCAGCFRDRRISISAGIAHAVFCGILSVPRRTRAACCRRTFFPARIPGSVRVLGSVRVPADVRVLNAVCILCPAWVLCLSRIPRRAASGRTQRQCNRQKQDRCFFPYSIFNYI